MDIMSDSLAKAVGWEKPAYHVFSFYYHKDSAAAFLNMLLRFDGNAYTDLQGLRDVPINTVQTGISRYTIE